MSYDAQQSGDSQFPRDASESNSKAPSDLFTSHILALLGLGNRYLPETGLLPALLAGMRNSDWRVRAAVTRRSGKLGEKAALEPLIAIMMHDTSSVVRVAAARALGDLADYMPVNPLPLLAVLDDPADDVKAAAAWALGKLGESVPISTPLENLLNCENATVRAAALCALGELGTRTPTHILMAALEDADWQVREMASLVLKRQRERITLDIVEPEFEE
ncbi:MAG: HEAT repeat domain-containing protein [Ktedonobacteraceae bacterium]